MVIYFYLLELHAVFTQPKITCQESITPHLPSRQFQIILLGDEKEDEVWTTLQCGGDGLYGFMENRFSSSILNAYRAYRRELIFCVKWTVFWYPKNINNTVPKQLSNKYGGLDEKRHQVFALPKTCHAAGRFRYKQSLPGSSSSGRWRSFLLRWGPTPTLKPTLRKNPIPILSYFLLGMER